MIVPNILTGFSTSQSICYPILTQDDSNKKLIQKCIFDNLTFNASLAFHTVTLAKIVKTLHPPKFLSSRNLYLSAMIISGIYTVSVALKYANPKMKLFQNTAPLDWIHHSFLVLNHNYFKFALTTLALYGAYHDKNQKPLILMLGANIITSKLLGKFFYDTNKTHANIPYFLSLIAWAGASYYNGLKG